MSHSQSKTFWSFLILVDVLLLVAFGWALADRLYTVMAEPVISVQSTRLPKAKDKKVSTDLTAPAGPPAPAAPAATEPAKTPEPAKKEVAKAPEPAKKETVKTPAPSKKEAAKPAPRKEEARKAEPGPVKAKKVVFTYKNKNAKKVSIEGTFTKWAPKAMNKDKSGEWRFTTYLLPGLEYPYRFVVDGKIITDPSNPREKWGKSLLPVK